jgi:hypothetical protein
MLYSEIQLKLLAVKELMKELREVVSSLDAYFYVDTNPSKESMKYPEENLNRLMSCISDMRKLLPELEGKLCMMANGEIGVINYPKQVFDALEFYIKAIKKECKELSIEAPNVHANL